MKTSEKLLLKLKKEFPEIGITDDTIIYRIYGLPDGVKFSWFATTPRGEDVYSYDTMTSCLKAKLSAIYNNGSTDAPQGWLVGTN